MGARLEIGFPGLYPKATSVQIKKKIPLTQQLFGIVNYEQSIVKLF